ncbi:3TM-type holin [Enterococcus rotai]|uniref:3TM-type holin n=1 Tax=Enterococcus rotai TaxID=118060 RepID=UPI0035C7776B
MALDPISAALELGTSVINKIWPDPVKQAEEQRKLQELAQKGNLEELNAEVKLLISQVDLNKVEAAHKSIFVAGWRPFVGWVCGFGLLYNVILAPFLDFWLTVPEVETDLLYPVLLGMLGLGGMRSFEKVKRVSREK